MLFFDNIIKQQCQENIIEIPHAEKYSRAPVAEFAKMRAD